MKALILIPSAMVALFVGQTFAASDPSIDRLLEKLPPPEKFVDPAANDPLNKKMMAAAKAQNFGIALESSRQLATRYPKSLGAQMSHGQIAFGLRQYPEATEAFHRALSVQPDFADAYFDLGLIDLSQQRFRPAFSDFQQVTHLAPTAVVGWIGSSMCAEKLGRKQDSLDYARRATGVAPAAAIAWYQLAREEGLAGHKQAASNALARANQLHKSAPQKHKDHA